MIARLIGGGQNLQTPGADAGGRVFRDDAMEAEFAEKGYVIRRILSRETVAELRAEVELLRPDDAFCPDEEILPFNYHMTELDTNMAYKRSVRQLGQAYLASPIAAMMADYRILITSLIVKVAGKGDFEMHNDWTVTEDPALTVVNVWCPLSDVHETNGALKLVEGSQKLLGNIDGPMIPTFYGQYEPRLRELGTTIPMEAGEAIFFDTTILHGSPDNLSDATRYAIRSVAIPANVRPVLYTMSSASPDELETFEMDGETYLENSASELATGRFNARRLGTVKNRNRTMDETQFMAALHNRRSGRTEAPSLLRRLRSALQI